VVVLLDPHMALAANRRSSAQLYAAPASAHVTSVKEDASQAHQPGMLYPNRGNTRHSHLRLKKFQTQRHAAGMSTNGWSCAMEYWA
jgi:hypothetical protein